ncbi:hypothetical protein SDC9_128400 [bioreactor metagenome]|uniref:Uncharacterized protein n=1 Tax=bioreactor metagenome TaxID=1076179 RepID=A0A645CWW8_9ZZZZ
MKNGTISVDLSVNTGLKVVRRCAHAALCLEFSESVNGLRRRGGAEELRYAGKSVLFRLLGEHKVLTVGL